MAQFKTFSGLRTYDFPLQRDLRELERWIRETEGRLAQLTSGEPIATPTGGSPSLVAHASTHEFNGSDLVESVNKLQVGAAPSASQAAGTVVITRAGSTTNDVQDVLTLRRDTVGTAAVGLGGRTVFTIEDDGGIRRTAANLEWVSTDITNPIAADVVLEVADGTTTTEMVRFGGAANTMTVSSQTRFDDAIGVGIAPPATTYAVDTSQSNPHNVWRINGSLNASFTVGGLVANAARAMSVFRVNTGAGIQTALFIQAQNLSATSGASVNGVQMTAAWAGSASNIGTNMGANILIAGNKANHTATSGDLFGGQFKVTLGGNNTSWGPVDTVAGNFLIEAKSWSNSSITEVVGGRFEPTVGGSNNTFGNIYACLTRWATSAATGTSFGNMYGFKIEGPSNLFGGTAVTHYGIHINDITNIAPSGNNDCIFIATQDGASNGATVGNIRCESGAWNEGHFRLGDAHIWFDGTTLYGNVTAPTGPTDGTDILGGGGGGDSFLEWAGL